MPFCFTFGSVMGNLSFFLASLAGALLLFAVLFAGAYFSHRLIALARIPKGKGRSATAPSKGAASDTAAVRTTQKPVALTRERLEQVLVRSKLYLNPDLKITDLLLPLGTNRTYLSNFINHTYGMSFRQLVNSLRVQEIDHVSHLQTNRSKNLSQLASGAGFGSYRNYTRARKQTSEAQATGQLPKLPKVRRKQHTPTEKE